VISVEDEDVVVLVKTVVAGLVLDEALFVGAMLVGTVLTGAVLIGAVLIGAVLIGAVLIGAVPVKVAFVGI
jgi:uncharacterized protein YjbI with pentapeptide repeats